jgi:L-glyceraldehyde 3-phosphate reductase
VQAATLLRDLGMPLLIHQPSYSCSTGGSKAICSACWTPNRSVASASRRWRLGLLTDKYVDGVPGGSRGGRQGDSWKALLTGETLAKIRTLNDIAARKGQSLAQMALAWTLRDPRVTSTLVGAASVDQL